MELFLSTAGLVFVAELGDKTQLVAMAMGARHRLAPVLAGLTAAYATTNLLSVVVGGLLGAALPTRPLRLGSGVLFLGVAAWTLRADRRRDGGGPPGSDPRGRGEHDPARGDAGLAGSARVAAGVAGSVIVAELGDKTMLATASLATQGPLAVVWFGATLGIVLSGTVGVLVGRVAGARLPERATRLGASALFAVFGIALIATTLAG